MHPMQRNRMEKDDSVMVDRYVVKQQLAALSTPVVDVLASMHIISRMIRMT